MRRYLRMPRICLPSEWAIDGRGLSPLGLTTLSAAPPQSGFKPRRVSINRALPATPPRSSVKSAYPRGRRGLAWPSSPVSLLRILLALVRCPARLGRSQRPPRPTGPSLREGYAVLPLLATMTRCADLDDSPGLPRDRLVIPGALPDDLVWAAIETVPTLSHSPLSACQCLYAGGIDGCTGPDPSPSSSPSPSKGGLGSLIPCPWLF
jgi:hypothetical protein